MSEWQRLRLGDLIDIKHGYAFKGEYFSDDGDGPLLLTPGNFMLGGGFKSGKPKYYLGAVPDAFELAAGDLVVTMTDLSKSGDTLGYPAIIPSGPRYLHNQRIGLVRVRTPDKIDRQYLYSVLRTDSYRRHILAGATGSTVRHTSPSRIYDFEFAAPRLCEQQAIAAVLVALDDKIAVNDRVAATSEALVASLLQRALAEDAGRSDVLLSEIALVNRRKVTPSPGGYLRYIDISSVSPGRIDWPPRALWSEAPGRARRGVSPGDTIWSTVRPGRRSHALVLAEDPELVVSTGFAVLTPVKVGPAFLYEVTKRDEFVQYLESVAEGSAYPAVRADRFEQATVPLLSPRRLQVFEEIALPLHGRVNASQAESRALAELRDGLLPRLMSGEIRVREAERIVEDVT